MKADVDRILMCQVSIVFQDVYFVEGTLREYILMSRPDATDAADQITEVDAGRVAQRGTHTQLLDTCGVYRDFWTQRTQAEGWRLVR